MKNTESLFAQADQLATNTNLDYFYFDRVLPLVEPPGDPLPISPIDDIFHGSGHHCRLPNDSYFWSPLNWGILDMGIMMVWCYSDCVDPVTVAVLDNSFFLSHSDLTDNFWIDPGVPVKIQDNPADPMAYHYEYEEASGIEELEPLHGSSGKHLYHGTKVLGLMAATANNHMGLAGICRYPWNNSPDEISFMPVMIPADMPRESSYAYAFQYAVEHGARVINLSGGFYLNTDPYNNPTERKEDYPLVESAVQYLEDHGVVLVAASGNSKVDHMQLPALFDTVIAVGGVWNRNSTGGGSQLEWADTSYLHRADERPLDVVAPTLVVTTSVDEESGEFHSIYADNSHSAAPYTLFRMSSAATPHVAGVVALMLSVNGALTPAEVRQIIRETAVDLGDEGQTGYGFINAAACIEEAAP